MSRIYADIIVDISQEKLDKSFQYEIPEELQGQVEIGKRVRIPFGNGGRELTGYVIGLSEEPKIEPDRIKAILAVEDRGMEIESRLISLAGWIARQYGSTMNQALKTVLPVKEKKRQRRRDTFVWQRRKRLVYLFWKSTGENITKQKNGFCRH